VRRQRETTAFARRANAILLLDDGKPPGISIFCNLDTIPFVAA